MNMDGDIAKLNVDRPDHLNLYTLLTQVRKLHACWLDLQNNSSSSEELTVFSRVLHEIANLSEEHRYFQAYELVCEMESTVIALGRKQGELNDSVIEYMSSCLAMLETLCHQLTEGVLKETTNQISLPINTAPRVYFFDESQRTSQALAVDIKGHGYQVLSFRCMDDLVHAIKFREPIAVIVFLGGAELSETDEAERSAEISDQQELLLSVMGISSGRVPCIAVGQANDMISRLAAAGAGVNSFYMEPLPLAILVSELFSLRHISMTQKLRVILLSESENQSSALLESTLTDSGMQVVGLRQPELLVEQLLARQYSQNIDAVVLYDQGNESLLRQCFALMRQDPVLEVVPLFVVTENKVRHSELFMRLILLGSAGHFSMADMAKPGVSSQLLLKIQSNILRFRRQSTVAEYKNYVEMDSGLLTRLGFYQQCAYVLSTLEAREDAPPMMLVFQIEQFTRFANDIGLSDEDARRRVSHGLIGLLSPMDRLIMLSGGQFVLFLAQVDKPREQTLKRNIEGWFEHFTAQYSERVDIQTIFGGGVVSDNDLQRAVRDALGAVHWRREQLFAKLVPVTNQISDDETVVPFSHEGRESASSQPTKIQPVTGAVSTGNWPVRIKQAIKTRRLSLVFQPIVSLEMDKYERYEVLLRLNELEEVISPSSFMNSMNDAALVNYIDRWVIATALKELSLANGVQPNISVFFIKLTAKTIADRTFIPWLQKALVSSKVMPSQCVFELPESVLLETFAESQDTIRRIRELGAKISVAHFGADEQSLTLFEYYELDFVKLDRCFVSDDAGQWSDQLKVIMQKAKQKNITVLAGFVENTESMLSVIQQGVGLVLGDFLQPPEAERRFDFAINL